MPKEQKNCLMCHMTINRKVHSQISIFYSFLFFIRKIYIKKKNCIMPKEHKADQKNYKGR